MPIPLTGEPIKDEIVDELRRIAGLVDKITVSDNPVRDYRELAVIRNQLKRASGVLQKGTDAKRFTVAQIRSLASSFKAIGAAIEKTI
jgi:hypothetical protein